MSAVQMIREALIARHNGPRNPDGYVVSNDINYDKTVTQSPIIIVSLLGFSSDYDAYSHLPENLHIRESFQLLYRQRVNLDLVQVESRLMDLCATDVSWLKNRGVAGLGLIRFEPAVASMADGGKEGNRPLPDWFELSVTGNAERDIKPTGYTDPAFAGLGFTPTAIIAHRDLTGTYPLNYREAPGG